MITGDLTVAELIHTYPQLIDVLADYHPHFAKFRSRALRRVIAPRVTIEQAARMAGVLPEDLVTTLQRAAGDAASATERVPRGIANAEHVAPTPRPDPLVGVPDSRRTVVDVREDVRRGEEPFAKIMAAVRALGSDLRGSEAHQSAHFVNMLLVRLSQDEVVGDYAAVAMEKNLVAVVRAREHHAGVFYAQLFEVDKDR